MIIVTPRYAILRMAIFALLKVFAWRLIGFKCYWNLTTVQLNGLLSQSYSWLSSTQKALLEILILRCALKLDLSPCCRYGFKIFWLVLDDSVTVRLGLVICESSDTIVTRRFFHEFSPSLNDNMIGMNCPFISPECFRYVKANLVWRCMKGQRVA